LAEAGRLQPVENGKLRTIVHSTVEASTWISVCGFTSATARDLRHPHMSSGEKPGSKHPNRDGAAACCFRTQEGQEVRRWIFLDFSSQQLP
jgi:hypothetical protein